ncbi:MAG: hypothetical protein N4A35_00910 [Flavobacteriales bacterium]|jgi:hypothetical protein|nr:hypothetical protein [Flavobacteriales bacterium]
MKNIKIVYLLIMLMGLSSCFYAQGVEGVKIGSTVSPPNPSTMLEVKSSNKGVLFPKVALTDINVYAPIVGTATEGVLIYNTNESVINGCGKGYYFWNGNYWERMGRKCVPQMTFAEMVAFTSNLTAADIGYQVYVTDTSIPSSDLSPCFTTGCTPATVNPQGIWSFTNTKLYSCNCGGVLWSKDIVLPTVSCTGGSPC